MKTNWIQKLLALIVTDRLDNATYGLEAIKNRLLRSRQCLVFGSAAPKAIIVVPAVAADLAFPDVVVSGIPSGATITSVEAVLIIGGLLDTSTAENQIAAAAKALRVKKSSGAWGTDDIVALTFVQNSLQCAASSYRGGVVLYGATDISGEVDGPATYNFQSNETNRSDAVVATGASLELLDVSMVLKVWFRL